MTSEQELNLVLDMLIECNFEPACFGWSTKTHFNTNMSETPSNRYLGDIYEEPLTTFMQELIGLFILKVIRPMTINRDNFKKLKDKEYLKTLVLDSYFNFDPIYSVSTHHPAYFNNY